MITLVLPFPPSVNTYWRSPNKGPLKGKHMVSEKGREYKVNVLATVLEAFRGYPKPERGELSVYVMLHSPDKRRRDIDNYCKAIFDALTSAGIWIDDSQIKKMSVEWGAQQKEGAAVITIEGYKK